MSKAVLAAVAALTISLCPTSASSQSAWTFSVAQDLNSVNAQNKGRDGRSLLTVYCNHSLHQGFGLSAGGTLAGYQGKVLPRINDVNRPVSFTITRGDGTTQTFAASIQYVGYDKAWVVSNLSAAFIDEFGRGAHMAIKNARGESAVEFDLTGTAAARNAMVRFCTRTQPSELDAQLDRTIREANTQWGAHYRTGKFAEAAESAGIVADAARQRYGAEHPRYAIALSTHAQMLEAANQMARAEALLREAVRIAERSVGSKHHYTGQFLNNLAMLLLNFDRRAEAEPLQRRAVAISESLDPESRDHSTHLSNLAVLLFEAGRLADAEPLMRRIVAIRERILNPEDPLLAQGLRNLADLLIETGRAAQAEPLIRRSLAITEKSLKPDDPRRAAGYGGMAKFLAAVGRTAEAEQYRRRDQAITEASFGPDHPYTAQGLMRLAALRAEQGAWADTADMNRRAARIMLAVRNHAGGERSGLARDILAKGSETFRAGARALYRSAQADPAARDEGFQLAQWALQTGAADALANMAVRFAQGNDALATLVRDRQDLIKRRQSEDRQLVTGLGGASAARADAMRSGIAALDRQLDDIDRRLAQEFPDYTALANPRPLTIAAAQALLKPHEALVAFIDVARADRLPDETLAWVVTQTDARWISIPLGTVELAERVAALRCGLDASAWKDGGEKRCLRLLADLVSRPPAENEALPFDPARAHALYQRLLAPFSDLTKGKHLLIVPAGPLTTLPFQVLVTRAPAATGEQQFRQASWLAIEQPLAVLPSVGSLKTLRELPASRAREPYIGFGNPLLIGGEADKERAEASRARSACAPAGEAQQQPLVRAAMRTPRIDSVMRGAGIDLQALRSQPPLPETADEVCAVGKAMNALAREQETIWLGERATETNLKTLSRAGRLANYRVLHFATHGVLAGESETILKARAEPALVMSPPQDGPRSGDPDRDDGLLTASEVSELRLDADWVVLSACNTAAGEKGNAEPLAGLARAFFYARARALLVSHWYVQSDAAVKLTTDAFAQLAADAKIGRGEALRRAMVKMITAGAPEEAHPAYWAPFVLVGEGAQ